MSARRSIRQFVGLGKWLSVVACICDNNLSPKVSSLFAQSLPVKYLNRIWVIFLYEGEIHPSPHTYAANIYVEVPFLFRLGMAIVHCGYHYVLSSTSEAAALEILVHRPATYLP